MPAPRKGYWMAYGVTEDGHIGRMGAAYGVFSWLVARQAGEHGIVMRGKEISCAKVAADLGPGYSRFTVQRHLRKLATMANPSHASCTCGCAGHGYVRIERGRHGWRVWVLHQKRFTGTPPHRSRYSSGATSGRCSGATSKPFRSSSSATSAHLTVGTKYKDAAARVPRETLEPFDQVEGLRMLRRTLGSAPDSDPDGGEE